MAYATADEVAHGLHLTRPTPEDVAALELCLGAATAEIDAWIDAPPEPPPPAPWSPDQAALLNRVAVVRAVEWWKANDAAFGLVGSAELGQLRAPRDGFSRHALSLFTLKKQWGVA
jgi:hypothetical protein